MKTESNNYKSVFKQDFKELATKLELKIEQTSNSNLKWFVGMFFALALMIIILYIKK